MRNENTFGLHFILRVARTVRGKSPIYARIVVNKSRCELALKCHVRIEDWNDIKGAAKPATEELKLLNSYLEEVRGKLVKHYRALHVTDGMLTAEGVKNAYLGLGEKDRKYTLLWVVEEHNQKMQKALRPGTMKNYHATAKYLRNFISNKFNRADINLRELNYEFISNFDHFVRNNSIKENDPCTNNGTMKHMERLKKMVNWAVKNEWLDKNPFINYNLKFNRLERDCLNEFELSAIQSHSLENPMLKRVRDLFIFSCYTGLAYIDLIQLTFHEIITGIDGIKWIKTIRGKTGVAVNIPILQPAAVILNEFSADPTILMRETVFPNVSNQEMNRSLKLIAEICGIKKYLTFHLARHTFATTVTLMNGVPIETISKLLGHTKLSTTMIYARVTQSKIGLDMELLQNKLNDNDGKVKMITTK